MGLEISLIWQFDNFLINFNTKLEISSTITWFGILVTRDSNLNKALVGVRSSSAHHHFNPKSYHSNSIHILFNYLI